MRTGSPTFTSSINSFHSLTQRKVLRVCYCITLPSSHTYLPNTEWVSRSMATFETSFFFITSALHISCFLTLCDIYRLTFDQSKCRGCCLLRNHCSVLQHSSMKTVKAIQQPSEVSCCQMLSMSERHVMNPWESMYTQ